MTQLTPSSSSLQHPNIPAYPFHISPAQLTPSSSSLQHPNIPAYPFHISPAQPTPSSSSLHQPIHHPNIPPSRSFPHPTTHHPNQPTNPLPKLRGGLGVLYLHDNRVRVNWRQRGGWLVVAGKKGEKFGWKKKKTGEGMEEDTTEEIRGRWKMNRRTMINKGG
ncbi:hypothetical protein Pmani_025512 [Petrolisthes manimaculis]|uniref:Uncharacterized protein n=1 Tax=Petrolisthes manimaculis TaxID=1843537 RepID=A0AAE1P5C8_9EUCA|nr:hypothetical protein Pmani_025512 [Petrolisthes manimaculis]